MDSCLETMALCSSIDTNALNSLGELSAFFEFFVIPAEMNKLKYYENFKF
jgi:hypothetical protein